MRIVYFRLFSLKNATETTKMTEERTIIITENENAEEVEAYEEKIIKLLAEILMEIQE